MHLSIGDLSLFLGVAVVTLRRWDRSGRLRHGTKIITLDDKPATFESELAQDIITIITVFSAKLYGSRSHQNKQKKLMLESSYTENVL
jgi:predicted site-specific integrase-resolvase